MISVSIIVPVYKAEKYLPRCLESIKKQTLTDFECILIDDGSPDSSGKICDDVVSEDSRFSVVHLENGGVSRARNEGIRRAKGTYIGFVDSDDWIEANMFETLYSDAIKNNSDVSICGVFGEEGSSESILLFGKEAIVTLYSEDGFQGYSWNKLIRNSLISQVLYDEKLKCYEDINMLHRLFRICRSVIWHNVPLYHYEKNESSVTSSYKFSPIKKEGLESLKHLAAEETDEIIKESMDKYFFFYYLETAIDYVSHKDVEDKVFPVILEEVKTRRKWLSSCSTRQRVWYRIIFSERLRKVYWLFKSHNRADKRNIE